MNIHTSKSGRTAYTPGFINQNGRDKPEKPAGKKILEFVLLLACIGFITGFVIGGADLVVNVVEYLFGG